MQFRIIGFKCLGWLLAGFVFLSIPLSAYGDKPGCQRKVAKVRTFYKTLPMLGYENERARGVRYIEDLKERETYRLTFKNGKIYQGDKVFDTSGSENGFAIFVMDEFGNFYASIEQRVWFFHHSSFLAGRPVACAGVISVRDGELTMISNESGHYKPNEAFMLQALNELKRKGISTEGRVNFFNGRNSVVPQMPPAILHHMRAFGQMGKILIP